jgi:esterase/lipase
MSIFQASTNEPNNILNFLLSQNINVMCWNYRGYGLSEGSPSAKALCDDVTQIYDYMRQVLKLTGKIGIYGCSLGGIPASYLPSVRDVELVVCDRTFSSLDAMA